MGERRRVLASPKRAGGAVNAPAPAHEEDPLMNGTNPNRRPYGAGSLLTTTRSDGTRVYYAKFRDSQGRQVKAGSGSCAARTSPMD